MSKAPVTDLPRTTATKTANEMKALFTDQHITE